jgi:hypothetical protein
MTMKRIVTLLLIALPLFAQQTESLLTPGAVVVQIANRETLTMAFSVERFVVAPDGSSATLLTSFHGAADEPGFFSPGAHQLLFVENNTLMRSPDGTGRTSIVFSNTAPLSEVAPMLNGNYLVGERSNDPKTGARLIEIDPHGRPVAYYVLPLEQTSSSAVGAVHFELLEDNCTVLYDTGVLHSDWRRVRRFNICTNRAEPDFARVPDAEQTLGSIRQLPGGDVLIAAGDVFRYSRDGVLRRSYLVRTMFIALTPDGSAFWTTDDGGRGRESMLRRISLDDPVTVLSVPLEQFATGLTVVGEWRASVSPASTPRSRSVRK